MRVASATKRLLKDDIFFWFTQKPTYKGRRIRERHTLKHEEGEN